MMLPVSWLLLLNNLLHSTHSAICSPSDPVSECNALIDFGMNLNYKNWFKNINWMSNQSICDWYGIICNNNHVTGIQLKANNLSGSIVSSIGNLTYLEEFNLTGTHPDTYWGCANTNLHNTSLPDSFYNLKNINNVALDWNCLGGILSNKMGQNWPNLRYLQLHGNWFYGTIPQNLDNCRELEILKFGRNPISGTIPVYKNLKKLQKFNCNYCAITGEFPESNLLNMPVLQQLYWDGNALTGTLPSTIGTLKHLTAMSFNINSLSGIISASLCDNPPESCRIGSDTNYSIDHANYPWIIKVSGNMYKCPLPPCADKVGRTCDPSDSIVLCQ
eukprot:249597_1